MKHHIYPLEIVFIECYFFWKVYSLPKPLIPYDILYILYKTMPIGKRRNNYITIKLWIIHWKNGCKTKYTFGIQNLCVTSPRKKAPTTARMVLKTERKIRKDVCYVWKTWTGEANYTDKKNKRSSWNAQKSKRQLARKLIVGISASSNTWIFRSEHLHPNHIKLLH